jgi:hypothetical protein
MPTKEPYDWTLIPYAKRLTARQVGDLLGCSAQHVRNLASTGRLPDGIVHHQIHPRMTLYERKRTRRGAQRPPEAATPIQQAQPAPAFRMKF